MRLKTKLVLAITTLVFLISGALSLVYVSQLLHSVVQQSFDTNKMVANQVRFALQEALETGLKDRQVDPGNPAQLRDLAGAAVRDNATLRAVVDSVNRYSLTVYDVNIGDSQAITLVSTNPDNVDKPLPARANYNELLNANPIQLMAQVFGVPRVYDIVVPLERNRQPFVTVHVGVRTTLLRAFYAPWLAQALTLMLVTPAHGPAGRLPAFQPGAAPDGGDQPSTRLLDRRRGKRDSGCRPIAAGHGGSCLGQD